MTDIRISKYLSHLLRHGAQEKNLPISSDGFVSVSAILNLQQSKSYQLNLEIIQRIVETNDKKRFELKQEVNEYFIRACQGHSIRGLDETKMMREIKDPAEFPIVVHGTYEKNWLSIQKEGLKRMNRNHIHFAIGYPKDNQVISGMRTTCNVLVQLDLEAALNDGIKFYLSTNKVVLSPGINGIITPKYFKNVEFIK